MADARVTQVIVETIGDADPVTRVTQVIVEALQVDADPAGDDTETFPNTGSRIPNGAVYPPASRRNRRRDSRAPGRGGGAPPGQNGAPPGQNPPPVTDPPSPPPPSSPEPPGPIPEPQVVEADDWPPSTLPGDDQGLPS